ncbi:MAG: hypothetical protein NZ772_01070 [Cyanobacteria bacterium]|nr:hypothetical protein [Cyanobacteriota bacterium]MDW8201659.1 hypothetical protein [Cyanobacteriota bacterium SKYGB_h_bin112]
MDSNELIPWNYARFLNYATDLTCLPKVGGGYIFIHHLLLEYFAESGMIASPICDQPYRSN